MRRVAATLVAATLFTSCSQSLDDVTQDNGREPEPIPRVEPVSPTEAVQDDLSDAVETAPSAVDPVPPTAVSTTVAADPSTTDVEIPPVDLGQIPFECDPEDIGPGLDVLDVVGCDSDGWAITREYRSCNTQPCPASDLWVVWHPDVEVGGFYIGYDTKPWGNCADHVRAQGGPDWLLSAVPFPGCDGETLEVNYGPEPEVGPLSLGDVGPRVKRLQAYLQSGEWSLRAVDGYYGFETARTVRLFGEDSGLPLDATSAYIDSLAELGPMCASNVGSRPVGIDHVPPTSPACEQALDLWARAVAVDDQVESVTFDDGWECTVGPSRSLPPGVDGICALDELNETQQFEVYEVEI